MVEFVHLPIHVPVEQDGLVLTAKQVCVCTRTYVCRLHGIVLCMHMYLHIII